MWHPGEQDEDLTDAIQRRPQRRTFRRRRDNRACDTCRHRKIKCDLGGNGPCSACVSAGLVCKTTDKNKSVESHNNARCIELESQVQQLSTRLVLAETHIASVVAEQARMQASDCRTERTTIDGRSTSSSVSPSDRHHQYSSLGDTSNLARQMPVGSAGSDTQLHDSHEGTNRGHFFGSTSGVVFASSIKDYVQRLGYDTSPSATVWRSSLHTSKTRLPSPEPNNVLIDELVALLPSRQLATKLLDLYDRHVQEYTPTLFWPSIIVKFRRLFTRPVVSSDEAGFVKAFCLLNGIWSVGSQLSNDTEARHESGDPLKNGWKFFELAKKYHNLMTPNYDVDDVAITLLMSVYLQSASLPNPCWIMAGVTARISQDLGLHRRPAAQLFTPTEIEARNRLFWGAYLLDRKIALSLGRPVILSDVDCSIDLPHHTNSDSASQASSIDMFRTSVEVASKLNDIIRLHIAPGDEGRAQTLLTEIDSSLSQCWGKYPRKMTDFSAPDAYEPSCLKLLFVLQQARLSTMRHFTNVELGTNFRKWCFESSVLVSTITSSTVTTLSHKSNWEEKVASLCNDVVFNHVFRAAVVLLLAHSPCADLVDQFVPRGSVTILWRFLVAASRRHTSALKYLRLLEILARALAVELRNDNTLHDSISPFLSFDDNDVSASARIRFQLENPRYQDPHDLTYFDRARQDGREFRSQAMSAPLRSTTTKSTSASYPATHFPARIEAVAGDPAKNLEGAAGSGTIINSSLDQGDSQAQTLDWDFFDEVMNYDSSMIPLDLDRFPLQYQA